MEGAGTGDWSIVTDGKFDFGARNKSRGGFGTSQRKRTIDGEKAFHFRFVGSWTKAIASGGY